MEGLDFLGADEPTGFRTVEEWCRAIGRGAGSSQCGPGPHRRGPACPPLTHCTDPIVGADGMPAFTQLQPYFLTEYPTNGEQLVALYEGYLRAYDALVNDIFSVWHPVSTGAVVTALRTARGQITDLWAKGGANSIMAVQMLAGLMGWFNATYRQLDGGTDWPALNQPVNAGVIAAANDAAKATVEAAKAAGKAVGDGLRDVASTAWWTTALLVAGGLAVAGILGWKLLGSPAGQAVASRYLPGRR